ncbi:MAG: AEC family transporter [Alphaproteobacteria bacterium]|nr:AEC family transporter [Alphaproteobacteria bacterium]
MTSAWAALAPVFALVALGFVLKRIGFPGAGFWPVAEKLTYFLLFPALLFESLATAELEFTTAGPMAAALAAGVLATAALALGLKPLLALDGPAFTSVFQGAIRPNTYVGIAVALGVWGRHGAVLAAIAIAVVVPLVNLLCVAVLARFGGRSGRGPGQFIAAVLGNPLILACAGGALVNLSGLSLPGWSVATLELAGKGALLLGLIAVGAALEPRRLRSDVAALAWVALLKLGLFPALTFAAASLLGVPGPAWAIAVMYAGLPVSASSYVLASQMGGDTALIAGALTATTLLAALTLPALLILLGL